MRREGSSRGERGGERGDRRERGDSRDDRGGRSSRGGRGGDSGRRGGRGGRGGRGRGGQFSGRGRRQRNPRAASDSGNQRERIAVESGDLVFIDQFMLANPQFVDILSENVDASPEMKDRLVQDFGGCVIKLTPGTYKIERDPFRCSIVIHPEDSQHQFEQLSEQATPSGGRVFVDTRCLAMVDRELLDDVELLKRYQALWFQGEDKACRDLLRDNGGAVRYGFHRYGDELGVYTLPDQNVVCLWPDVSEPGIVGGADKTIELSEQA